jgi:hypothetical protein
MTPLLQGGQGRTPEDLQASAIALVCIALAFVATVAAVAWRTLA